MLSDHCRPPGPHHSAHHLAARACVDPSLGRRGRLRLLRPGPILSGDLTALAEAITPANEELTSITGTLKASANGQPLSKGQYKAALVDGQPTAMQLGTVTSADGGQQLHQLELELWMVDGVSYVGGEQILQQLGVAPGSGTWVQLDKNSPNSVIAQLATEMEVHTQTQGPQQIQSLATDGQSMKEIGAEDVGGTATTHYQVMIDGQRALELSGSGASSPEAAQALPDAVPLDLWVDDQNRLVQVKMESEVEGQVLTLMMGFTGFDDPVDVVVPAPGKLAEPSAAPLTT